jgi:hypothetical protein
VILLTVGLCLSIDYTEFNMLNNAINKEADKIASSLNADTWFNDWKESYDLLTRNEEYQRKFKERSNKFGDFSSEGNSYEINKKEHELEERKLLKELYDSKKYSDDPDINKKLYEYYLRQFTNTALRNDKLELIPVTQIPD